MWRDPAWLLDMLHASQKCLEYVSGMPEDKFQTSQRDQDAVLRQLTIVGEAVKRVSLEFRSQHPEVPWKKIAGFRDVVVHDYFNVDIKEVWRILQEDLPALVELLVPLIPPEEPGSG